MKPALTQADIAAATAGMTGFADPVSGADHLNLLRRLYAIGREDLPLGRLVEGHVDALQIVHRYGTPEQATEAARAARKGRVFGVWNADRPGDATRLEGALLFGSKAFASGAGLVTDALISVDAPAGRQLLLLDLEAAVPAIDRGWWQVTGMARSQTHIATWSAQPVAEQAWIGAPGDYVREPWFSGGALRFAAVQAGGIAGLCTLARDHLVAADRSADPFQSARLADLYRHAQAATDAVRTAAQGWAVEDSEATIARVAAARVAVYAAGEAVLALAAAAVGVTAMFADDPVSEHMRDLDTYLRQPGPDAQRLLAGRAVAERRLVPAL